MRYPIVIEVGDANTTYGVVVPDLPGCFSAGDSFDEAVSNTVEAITLWVEDALENGVAVPRPSTLDSLKKNSDYQGENWVWGFASVDPTLFDDTTERVNITLPRRVLARLDAEARAAGETRSGYIARLAISP